MGVEHLMHGNADKALGGLRECLAVLDLFVYGYFFKLSYVSVGPQLW